MERRIKKSVKSISIASIASIVKSDAIWVEKYRPKTLTDYYMSKHQMGIVKDWIISFQEDKNKEDIKPFLILYGNAGIGKTTLAHLIFQKYNYDIIECNASDFRSKKNIGNMIGQISTVSITVNDITKSTGGMNNFKKTAIIMDEIDGLTGGESGGVQELLNIIVSKNADQKTFRYLCPVICTTNSVREKKLLGLIKHGIMIHINKPNNADCHKLLEKIMNEEHFTMGEESIKQIIINANGDYRQLIYLIYEYYLNEQSAIHGKPIKLHSQLHDISNCEPDEDNHYNAMRIIQNMGTSPLEKINYFLTNNVSIDDIRFICSGDSNLFFLNTYFNIPSILGAIQTKTTKEELIVDLKKMISIFDDIKYADIINTSKFSDNNWELLELSDYIGIATPIKLMNEYNLKQGLYNKKALKHFTLSHHTPYNYMRQEQSINVKQLKLDYLETQEIDIINIYYYMKIFKEINKSKIPQTKVSRSKKKILNTFEIDKLYLKLLDKVDSLL